MTRRAVARTYSVRDRFGFFFFSYNSQNARRRSVSRPVLVLKIFGRVKKKNPPKKSPKRKIKKQWRLRYAVRLRIYKSKITTGVWAQVYPRTGAYPIVRRCARGSRPRFPVTRAASSSIVDVRTRHTHTVARPLANRCPDTMEGGAVYPYIILRHIYLYRWVR